MMQSDMFVAAERFSAEVRGCMFTHYKRLAAPEEICGAALS